MTQPAKARLSAKEVLTDIRAGLGSAGLKEKYGLSDKGLQSLMSKLTAKGLLSEKEAAKHLSEEAAWSDLSDGAAEEDSWICPACKTPLAESMDECPVCGVVISKLRSRLINGMSPTPIGAPSHRPRQYRRLGVAVAVILVAVGITVAYFLVMQSELTKRKPRATRKTVEKPRQKHTKQKIVDARGKKILMKYEPKGFPLGLSVTQGTAGFYFEKPGSGQAYTKMPPETGLKRYYDDFKIAGGTYPVVTEASEPPKMYFDANKNGDMTDDPGPFTAEGKKLLPNHYTLTIPYPLEKTSAKYRLRLFSSRMGGIAFYSKCHRRGEITIGGATYPIVLFDANADGDYSNDPAVIDVDGNGKISTDEKLTPGESITIDGAEVKLISIAPSGKWARFDY